MVKLRMAHASTYDACKPPGQKPQNVIFVHGNAEAGAKLPYVCANFISTGYSERPIFASGFLRDSSAWIS